MKRRRARIVLRPDPTLDIVLSFEDWTVERAFYGVSPTAQLVRAAGCFARGCVTAPGRPETSDRMWELLTLAAASGAGIADETLASAALSEARLEVTTLIWFTHTT